jgi:hypothetical protein
VLVHSAHSTIALAEGDEDSIFRTLRGSKSKPQRQRVDPDLLAVHSVEVHFLCQVPIRQNALPDSFVPRLVGVLHACPTYARDPVLRIVAERYSPTGPDVWFPLLS